MERKSKTPALDLMTIADACLALGVSRRTLYRMIAEELLPAPKRLGKFRHAYFDREEFKKKVWDALA